MKLNKILFWADVQAFRERSQPVTGMRYRRLPHGPAPTALIPALKQLEDEGACHEEQRRLGTRTQKRVVPDREPDLSLLEDWEREYPEAAIRDLQSHTATSAKTRTSAPRRAPAGPLPSTSSGYHGFGWHLVSPRRQGNSGAWESRLGRRAFAVTEHFEPVDALKVFHVGGHDRESITEC